MTEKKERAKFVKATAESRIGRIKAVYRMGEVLTKRFDEQAGKMIFDPNHFVNKVAIGVECLDADEFDMLPDEPMSHFVYVELTDSMHAKANKTQLLKSLELEPTNTLGLLGKLVVVEGDLMTFDDGTVRFGGSKKKLKAPTARQATKHADDQGKLTQTVFSIANPLLGTPFTQLNPYIRSKILTGKKGEALKKTLLESGITEEEMMKDIKLGMEARKAEEAKAEQAANKAEAELLASFTQQPMTSTKPADTDGDSPF